MSPCLISLLYLMLSLRLPLCERVICNETTQCQNQILQCTNENEACSLSCSSYYGCGNSTFICPESVTSCTIECNHHYACHSATIICSRNSLCNITGNGKYALAYSKINGPYKQSTHIQCNDDYSCKQAWIDTRHSIQMDITCDTTTQYDGCQDITLYCPYYEQITAAPTCTITQQFDGIRSHRGTHKSLSIYARNSWHDLQISWNVVIGVHSRMFCGDTYQHACLIEHKQHNEWNCADHASHCYVDHNDALVATEPNYWKGIWSARSIVTVVFVSVYAIVLLLSCRYGHKPTPMNDVRSNSKHVTLIHSQTKSKKEGVDVTTF